MCLQMSIPCSACMMWQSNQPKQAHRLYPDRLMAPFLCSYLDNMTSERVDAAGVKNIAAAAKANSQTQVPLVSLPMSQARVLLLDSIYGGPFSIDDALMTCTMKCDSQLSMRLRVSLMQDRKLTTVLSMGSEQDISRWERLDDVIMGGQSSSSLRAVEGGAALFSGDLILEGGGFCGARTKVRLSAPVFLGAELSQSNLGLASVAELANLVHRRGFVLIASL